MRKRLNTILEIAEQAKKEGLTVYLSKNKEHGFYTNGKYCISFGSPLLSGGISLSTNHKATRLYGTGFCLNNRGLNDYAPVYAPLAPSLERNKNPKVTPVTEKEHLEKYGSCCGFNKY